ncbi:MAG: dUTP diphosphatase [Bacteroidia bacterium]
MDIKIINRSQHELPAYQSALAAGMDLRADLKQSIALEPMERQVIPTGLYIELPPGFEAQIRPRSGLAARSGVTVLNSPGTIDADYRGEIRVLLVNLSRERVEIESGQRIAQMIVAKHERVEWQPVDDISATIRGDGGYGHTGEK